MITVGLGNDINPAVMQQIGNAGFYPASDASELTESFQTIQENIIKFTESFYWLNYITPKRGNNTHTLRVSLRENLNTTATKSFSTQFNSSGFYSVLFGITVNSSAQNLFGVDSLEVGVNSPTDIKLRVPFSFEALQFAIEGLPEDSISLVKKVDDTDTYILTVTGEVGKVKNIVISETVSRYTKSLKIILKESTSIEKTDDVPTSTSLSPNFPNPFNPTTVIAYQLAVSGNVKLSVFDVLGREVAVLVNGVVPAGSHTVTFDASNLTSGMYMYRLDSGGKVLTRKMMLVK